MSKIHICLREKIELYEAESPIPDINIDDRVEIAKQASGGNKSQKNAIQDAQVAANGNPGNPDSQAKVDLLQSEAFNEIFENNAEFALNLGEAVRVELQEKGFDKNNPFISFINTIANIDGVTSGRYAAVHNAYCDKLLDDDDILGNGDLKNNNLIFNFQLQQLPPQNIIKYLSAQKTALKKFAGEDLLTNFNETFFVDNNPKNRLKSIDEINTALDINNSNEILDIEDTIDPKKASALIKYIMVKNNILSDSTDQQTATKNYDIDKDFYTFNINDPANKDLSTYRTSDKEVWPMIDLLLARATEDKSTGVTKKVTA